MIRYIYEDLSPEEATKCYSRLREQIQLALYYMEQAMYYLNYTDNDLFNVYNVNEEKISSIKIEDMKSNLKQRINYLRYTVIPKIRSMENNL